MHPLLIVLAVLGGILFLALILYLFGRARIRILYQQRLRLILYVCGVKIKLTREEEKKPKLTECLDPYAALRREKRKAKKAAKKAAKQEEKKRLKAEEKKRKKQEKANKKASGIPAPNVIENLQMITALLKKLFTLTNGRLRLDVNRLHVTVATDDAAKTAVLYGVTMQTSNCLLQWLQDRYIPIHRKEGSIRIEPDFVGVKSNADVDLICTIKIRHAGKILLRMLMSYLSERKLANKKAARRAKQIKLAEQASNQGNN